MRHGPGATVVRYLAILGGVGNLPHAGGIYKPSGL